MSNRINALVKRQEDIANGAITSLSVPKFDSYCICNLRGLLNLVWVLLTSLRICLES